MDYKVVRDDSMGKVLVAQAYESEFGSQNPGKVWYHTT